MYNLIRKLRWKTNAFSEYAECVNLKIVATVFYTNDKCLIMCCALEFKGVFKARIFKILVRRNVFIKTDL